MKKRFFLILTCTLLLGTLTACSSKNEEPGSQTDAASEEEATDDAAAEPVTFEATTIEGDTISSDIFKNSRLTMLNVWATYCNPCLLEMPELGELPSEYDASDFQLLGIISNVPEGGEEDMLELAAGLIHDTSADYPHLLLNESLYLSLLTEVSAVPTTLFINQDGQVIHTVVGALDKETWMEEINGLLEEL